MDKRYNLSSSFTKFMKCEPIIISNVACRSPTPCNKKSFASKNRVLTHKNLEIIFIQEKKNWNDKPF